MTARRQAGGLLLTAAALGGLLLYGGQDRQQQAADTPAPPLATVTPTPPDPSPATSTPQPPTPVPTARPVTATPADPAPKAAARTARAFALAWAYHPPGHPDSTWRDAMAPYAEPTALNAALAVGGKHSYRALGQPRRIAGDARLAHYALDLDPETELRVVVADGPRGWAALVSWARSREHG